MKCNYKYSVTYICILINEKDHRGRHGAIVDYERDGSRFDSISVGDDYFHFFRSGYVSLSTQCLKKLTESVKIIKSWVPCVYLAIMRDIILENSHREAEKIINKGFGFNSS